MLGQHLPEGRRLGHQGPGPAAKLVALQPERQLTLPRLAPRSGLLPVRLVQRRDGAVKDAVLLLAEGVYLPEVLGSHDLQLVGEDPPHLVGNPLVGIAVIPPQVGEDLAAGLDERERQRAQPLQVGPVRGPPKVMYIFGTQKPAGESVEKPRKGFRVGGGRKRVGPCLVHTGELVHIRGQGL